MYDSRICAFFLLKAPILTFLTVGKSLGRISERVEYGRATATERLGEKRRGAQCKCFMHPSVRLFDENP